MTITAVLMLTAAIASPQGSDKHATVRVYLFTAPPAAALATPEETGRLAAVRDMRDALERRKGIALVDERAQANVIIEVMNREQREEPMGGFGGKSVTRMGDTIIRLHISSGDAEADLKGIGQGTWGRAAKDAADRVVKWIARREPSKLLPRQTALAGGGKRGAPPGAQDRLPYTCSSVRAPGGAVCRQDPPRGHSAVR